MKFKSRSIAQTAFSLVLVSLLAAGCASSRAPESAAPAKRTVQDISKQWKQGNDLVTEGQAKRAEAQELIDEAERIMKEGDTLVTRGESLKTESEEAFRATSLKAK